MNTFPFLLGHLWRDIVLARCDHVAGKSEESRSQARLSQHSKLDFIDAHSLVISLPVPARNVE